MNKELDVKLVEGFVANTQEIVQIETKISAAIAHLKQDLEARQAKDTELREALLVAMRDNGVKKFENDIVSLTYIAPTTRTAIDTTRLKEEKPELWKEYSKTSDVKDSVRIKVKGQEE